MGYEMYMDMLELDAEVAGVKEPDRVEVVEKCFYRLNEIDKIKNFFKELERKKEEDDWLDWFMGEKGHRESA